ncbi:broad-complex core protein isoforms 1/2/3/4/5-like isoform X1 [Homarus americanus]|uniref:broad-complex core protein isoforms 1/2/3/4/5-like isoform X1 n=1 Tax=Homarus americanus TaxID=6706 RepID=UPI001C43C92E|nr:broad-complex core protein isoforms 1/2/3/4/5-like isoform X1 [Homarus americanus]
MVLPRKCVMSEEEFLLKWNNHQSNFVDVFNELLKDESFVDVTLVCGGEAVPGHKMVLAACSPLLHRILRDNPCKHPLVILGDVPARDMRAMMKFIYQGEVSVSQSELASFLKTADNLQIKGLAEDKEKEKEEKKRKDKDSDRLDGRPSNKRQRTSDSRTTDTSSPLPSRSHKSLNDSHSSSHKSRSRASIDDQSLKSGGRGGGLHAPASKHNSSKNSSSKTTSHDIPSKASKPSEENDARHVNSNNSVGDNILPKEETVDELTVKTEPLDYPGEMVWTEGHGTINSDTLDDAQGLLPFAAIPGALEGVAAAIVASPSLPIMEFGEDSRNDDESRGDMSTASDDINANTTGGAWLRGRLAQGCVGDIGTVHPPSLSHPALPSPLPPNPPPPPISHHHQPQEQPPHSSSQRGVLGFHSNIVVPTFPNSTNNTQSSSSGPTSSPPSTAASNFSTTITTSNNNSVHKCYQCPFITSNPYTFTRHLRIHLGTKEFRCRVCGFASSRKDSLIRHFRMKHLTGEMSVYHDLDSRDIEELALIRGISDGLQLLPSKY